MDNTRLLENKAITKNRSGMIQDLHRVVSFLFIVMFAIGIVYRLQMLSTFFLEIPNEVVSRFIYSYAIVVIVKSILLLAADYRKEDYKYNRKWLAFAMLIAIVFCAVYYNLRELTGHSGENNYILLLFIAISVIGTVGIDYRKLIRLYVVIASFIIAVIVCSAICGAIPNYIYSKGWDIRSSWGTLYPTDMASYFFYICVFYWIAYCRENDLKFILPTVIALLIAHFVARSETSTFCDISLLIVITLNYFFKQGRLEKTKKITDLAAVLSFPVFTLLMMALMLAFSRGNSLAMKVNDVLSGRIALSVNAYREFGLSLLGAPLRQIGFGGGSFASEGYDFVDSTYPLLLLNYGIIMLIMVNVLWVLMTRKALKIGDRRLALGMALIAFHSLSEHHFIEPNFNVLIAMPVAVLMAKASAENDKKEEISGQANKWSARIPEAGVTSAAVIVLVIAAHRLLPWTRTIFTYSGLTDTPGGRRVLFVAMSALVVGLILSLYCVYDQAKEIIAGRNKDRIKKIAAVLLLIIAAGAGLLLKSNDYLTGAYEKRAEIVGSDQAAINIIKGSQGKLYVYGLPEFYKRVYGGISTSLFDGEELARYSNITVLVDKELDSPIFFEHGFLYAPVSDHHSVYSNDEKVIKALEKGGYKFHGFCSGASIVDLQKEAQRNGLEYSDGKPLCLSGGYGGLIMGPYYNLRTGTYTLTIDLELDRREVREKTKDTEIAKVEVTKNWGKEVIAETPVILDQFDEEGNCRVEIIYSIPDSRGVEFKIKPSEAIDVSVTAIENKKTPEYDIRRTYNSKGEVVREDYYDLDGNPIETNLYNENGIENGQ